MDFKEKLDKASISVGESEKRTEKAKSDANVFFKKKVEPILETFFDKLEQDVKIEKPSIKINEEIGLFKQSTEIGRYKITIAAAMIKLHFIHFTYDKKKRKDVPDYPLNFAMGINDENEIYKLEDFLTQSYAQIRIFYTL